MTRQRLIIYGLLIVGMMVFISVTYGWYKAAANPLIVNSWQTVTKTKYKTRIIPVEKIRVIEKEKIIKDLKLPESIKDDERQVISSAEVLPHEAKSDVVAILNTSTGAADIIVRPRPVPFAAFESRFGIGAGYYPWVSKNLGELSVDVSYRFGRIGRIHGQIDAMADVKGNYKAGIKAVSEW